MKTIIKSSILKNFIKEEIKEEYLKKKENDLNSKENILKEKEKELKTLPIVQKQINEDDKVITSSGKLTGGLFSGINSAANYIHEVAKINNLEGTLHKIANTFSYTYKGKVSDVRKFEKGISSLI